MLPQITAGIAQNEPFKELSLFLLAINVNYRYVLISNAFKATVKGKPFRTPEIVCFLLRVLRINFTNSNVKRIVS